MSMMDTTAANNAIVVATRSNDDDDGLVTKRLSFGEMSQQLNEMQQINPDDVIQALKNPATDNFTGYDDLCIAMSLLLVGWLVGWIPYLNLCGLLIPLSSHHHQHHHYHQYSMYYWYYYYYIGRWRRCGRIVG